MSRDNDRKVLPKPVDWDELYPGRFIRATEFKGKRVTLRITAVDLEKLAGKKGLETKGIVSFERTDKQWAINRTNGECVKAMFGPKVQLWVGKRVTLFPGVHDNEPCIRVWGSPDIEADFDVVVELPRKTPFKMTMHKTGVSSVRTQAQQQPPTDYLQRPAPAVQGHAARAAPPAEREPGADDEPSDGLPEDSASELTLAGEPEGFDPERSREIDLQLIDN